MDRNLNVDPARRALAAGMVLGLWLASPVYARADELDRLPDPTRPMLDRGAARLARDGLQLESTLVSARRATAVINGRSVQVGDRVDGATVARIQPHEVILRAGTRDIHLRLMPPLVKTRSVREN